MRMGRYGCVHFIARAWSSGGGGGWGGGQKQAVATDLGEEGRREGKKRGREEGSEKGGGNRLAPAAPFPTTAPWPAPG